MPIRVSTDLVRPSERQAFWTEAVCRSFANVETRPLRPGPMSGHFEVLELGNARVARFDTSPQSYSRNARLVNSAGSDDFMFDFQLGGRSWMIQGTREGAIHPGYGVLYDARRPFEDILDGHATQRAEVLIATVPAAPLIAAFPGAERWCAFPIPLSGTLGPCITRLLRAVVSDAPLERGPAESDIVTYLAALLRHASDGTLALDRSSLFVLVDIHIRHNLEAALCPAIVATLFGISERTMHRVFADRGTTFERHILRRRVERFRELLSQLRCSHVSIARLALDCGFADAAHASRTFKTFFQATPLEHRAAALCRGEDEIVAAEATRPAQTDTVQ